ncbi:MAG: trypsin-like peptidase domain-containing protein, partial [Solirubrobacterales bacterium]|nr:trypsin-like peptidase domain-containing protein [Solirubrobacterales bacterium]
SGPVRTVERVTTVEVVSRAAGDGGFDPAAIYARDSPGVVTVFSVLPDSSSNIGGDGGQGVGSGFVLNGAGEIATNAHVVTEGAGSVIREADEVYVAFADGNEVAAQIVGFDANADVALLKIDPAGLRLRPLKLGTAQDLRVGSPVAAIGSPFGEPQSLSVGVVSAKDRLIKSLTGFEIAGAIQTDAAINRGNSGGPLVNADGEVLGINSQIQTTSGGGDGVGYAVPVDTVRRTISGLRRDGKVDYAYLGVSTTRVYPQLAERFKLAVQRGAWVQEVVDGGPADEAGLRAGRGSVRFQARTVNAGGDIITAVDGKPLRDEAGLGVELLRRRPGQVVVLRVYREGRPRDVKLTLGSRPKQANAGVLP